MSPAPSSDRDAMFAKNAELDDGALSELGEFTAAFERRWRTRLRPSRFRGQHRVRPPTRDEGR